MLEPDVHPIRYRDESLISRFFERACTEVRRYEVTDQARVEGVSCEPHTAGGEQLGALFVAGSMRVQSQKGEVAGTATEVANEHHFLSGQRRCIVVSRCHRLELKLHVCEAGPGERVAETFEGEGIIGLRISADKVYRASHGGRLNGAVEVALRVLAQIAENTRDQIFQELPSAEYLRAGECAAGKIRFERLDEPALRFGSEVPLNTVRTAP
jgi:hypothetical protein